MRSLVKGNVLDDGDVVDTRRFLESREAKPMIDLLKPSQHKVLKAAFRKTGIKLPWSAVQQKGLVQVGSGLDIGFFSWIVLLRIAHHS